MSVVKTGRTGCLGFVFSNVGELFNILIQFLYFLRNIRIFKPFATDHCSHMSFTPCGYFNPTLPEYRFGFRLKVFLYNQDGVTFFLHILDPLCKGDPTMFSFQSVVSPAELSSAYHDSLLMINHLPRLSIRGLMPKAYRAIAVTSPWVQPSFGKI